MTQLSSTRQAEKNGRRSDVARADNYDWSAIRRALGESGNAVLPKLLDARQSKQVSALYPSDELYRTRIVMARHGFGRGEYKYFRYPLPDLLQSLRSALYPHLARIANHWNEVLGDRERFPSSHEEYLQRCHRAGQTRPTPLILRYVEGDYNCLHQDLYGDHVFPLQVAILLSQPNVDFEGGEFVMTEASSRQQRADVVALSQGDAVVFTVNQRPAIGRRGPVKVAMRHGVSRVRSGIRHTVGLIFHDSR